MVLLRHELPVRALLVPRVEAVVADHGQRLGRQRRLVPDDMIQILVVAPRQHHVVHAAAGGVDAVLRAVHRVHRVRVQPETLRVDDALVERAADGERVADDVPLALRVVEEQQLAQVVDEARELHPARLAVAPDRLGALQQVLDLAQRRVRVALVDQRVELLHGLPDRHLLARPRRRVEAVARRQVVRHRLLLVLLAVEGLDALARLVVLPELRLVLGRVELRLGVVERRRGGRLLALDVVHLVDGV